MMNGAKINNLGLSFLIRLSQFVEYLSFLGGETQRPILNSHGVAVPVCDSISPFHINPDLKMARRKKRHKKDFSHTFEMTGGDMVRNDKER
jgi:hypothetical protein